MNKFTGDNTYKLTSNLTLPCSTIILQGELVLDVTPKEPYATLVSLTQSAHPIIVARIDFEYSVERAKFLLLPMEVTN